MLVAIFARADHPEGWGFPQVDGFDAERGAYYLTKAHAPAHGYSVIAVRCGDQDELDAVCAQLRTQPFLGIAEARSYGEGALGAWFGGRFDHILTLSAEQIELTGPDQRVGRFFCLGDNRCAMLFEAGEILSAAAQA